MKDFEVEVKKNADVVALKKDVMAFITQFPMPGFDVAGMKYKHI